MIKPYILLAFANLSEEFSREELYEMGKERRDLLHSLEACQARCTVESHTEITLDSLSEHIHRPIEDLFVLHLNGFYGKEQLWLLPDSSKDISRLQNKWASLLKKAELRLLFLSGPRGKDYFLAAKQAGIPAIIYTPLPIHIRTARIFAFDFYSALSKDLSLRESYDEACQKLGKHFPRSSSMYEEGSDEIDSQPYKLYIRPGYEGMEADGLKEWYEEMLLTYPPEEKEKEAEVQIQTKYLHLLCDRDKATNQFEQLLEQPIEERSEKQAHRPQLIFLYGPDNEVPLSLSERCRIWELRDIFQRLLKVSVNDPARLVLDFPTLEEIDEQDLSIGQSFLERKIKKAFRIKQQQHLRRFLKSYKKNHEIIYIEHSLNEEHLHSQLQDLLKYYIDDFWKIELQASDPMVFLVFIVSWTAKEGWVSWVKRSHPYESLLQKLKKQSPQIEILPKLGQVKHEDIRRWQMKHRLSLPHLPSSKQMINSIFGKQKQLPMEYVETQLKEIVRLADSR